MIDLSLNRIPAAWQMLLNNVQAVEPDALLAGGCLRDLYLERPVSDIDLFVPITRFDAVRAEVMKTHPNLLKEIPEPYFVFDFSVGRVEYFGTEFALPPVNIVGVTDDLCTPWDQIERFDFGVCQIAFDGNMLHTTAAFGKDVTNQTFTITPEQTDVQRENTLKRYARISEKYADWKLIVPADQETPF